MGIRCRNIGEIESGRAGERQTDRRVLWMVAPIQGLFSYDSSSIQGSRQRANCVFVLERFYGGVRLGGLSSGLCSREEMAVLSFQAGLPGHFW